MILWHFQWYRSFLMHKLEITKFIPLYIHLLDFVFVSYLAFGKFKSLHNFLWVIDFLFPFVQASRILHLHNFFFPWVIDFLFLFPLYRHQEYYSWREIVWSIFCITFVELMQIKSSVFTLGCILYNYMWYVYLFIMRCSYNFLVVVSLI